MNSSEHKKNTLEKNFFIRGPEVGETISFPVCIIPFPVWTIPFPVLKINFEPLGTNEKHFVVEVFWSEAKKNLGAGWVGGWDGCTAYESDRLVKRDVRTHSGSSEHSLDSESKFEPSVVIRLGKLD